MDGAAGDAKEPSGLDESLSTPLPRDLPRVVRDAQDLQWPGNRDPRKPGRRPKMRGTRIGGCPFSVLRGC
jgi:hypothetical protein